ncbi:hypothetical protein R6Z07F_004990 [Ovis aries]
MPAQAVPVYPRRPAPCATPEKRIDSSPPLLLPSGFPGYRGSNPDGFLCVVPPPARRQGERDRRVVTSTASRPAARLRAERDLCSGGTCKHGDFEIRLRNSEPKASWKQDC